MLLLLVDGQTSGSLLIVGKASAPVVGETVARGEHMDLVY